MTIPKLDIDKVLAYQQGKDKRAPPYVIDIAGTEIIVLII
jgi:hypothetical protein